MECSSFFSFDIAGSVASNAVQGFIFHFYLFIYHFDFSVIRRRTLYRTVLGCGNETDCIIIRNLILFNCETLQRYNNYFLLISICFEHV